MLTRQLIEQLENFDGGGNRVLSIYLDIAPDRRPGHAYRVVLEDLAKEHASRMQDGNGRALLSEVDAVRRRLESEEPRGQGLALFSCAPKGLWHAHVLAVPFEDHLVFERQPDVAPLLEIVDEYERYAVALVDKQKVRLFTIVQGVVEERDAFEDFVIPKHDQGGYSQSNFQRHHEAHVYRHLKRVVRHLIAMHRAASFDRLIIAGPDEPANELVRLLPRALARRVTARIPGEMLWDKAEVLKRTLEVELEEERRVEQRLLDELFEVAGHRGNATYGIDATLEALWRGAVQKLVVSHGARLAGAECTSCGRLQRARARCSTCGGALEPVHDLFHRAMGKTLDEAGNVEIVHAEAAARLTERGAGLGALLRYRWT
jgi:peptide chain release factor subunit 1